MQCERYQARLVALRRMEVLSAAAARISALKPSAEFISPLWNERSHMDGGKGERRHFIHFVYVLRACNLAALGFDCNYNSEA
jgi:hypothetical protein